MNIFSFKARVHGVELGMGPNARTLIAGRVGSLLVACVSDYAYSKRELIVVAGTQTAQIDSGVATYPAQSYPFSSGSLGITMAPTPEHTSLDREPFSDLSDLLAKPDLPLMGGYISNALVIPDPAAVRLERDGFDTARPPSFLGAKFEETFVPYGAAAQEISS